MNTQQQSEQSRKALLSMLEDQKRTEEKLRAKTEELDKFFNTSLDLLCIADTDGYFHKLNPEWEKTLGYTLQELEGKKFLDFIHPDDIEKTLAVIADLSSQKEVVDFTNRYRCKDGTYKWIEWRSTPMGKLIYAAARDVTERKRDELLLATEKEVLEMISFGLQLPKILEKIVLNIESQTQETIASILLLDPDGLHVHYGAAPHLPEAYNKAIEGAEIGPCAGSCGTAAYRKEPVIVTDIETDPLWKDYRELARLHGLRACWSTPIINVEGTVLGTFAMYSRQPRSPKEEDYKLIERTTHLANIAIERNRTEIKLRESEAYNRMLFNQSVIGLALSRMDGQLVDVNPAYANIIGRTIEETLQLTYWDITPEKYAEQEQQQLESLKKTGHYGPYEKEYIHKDGHLFPVRLQGQIIEKSGEKFIWSSVEDITERKRAEDTLRKSEARYRKLIETEPECVKVLTEDNILRDMNPAGLAMIEADSPEQIIGKTVLGIINPEYRTAFTDLVKEVFRGGSGTLEFKITGLKGTKRWLETHAVPMSDESGKIYSLMSITRDITERKRAEEKIIDQLNELRRWQKVMVGRELRDVELKKEVNELLDQLGKQKKYNT